MAAYAELGLHHKEMQVVEREAAETGDVLAQHELLQPLMGHFLEAILVYVRHLGCAFVTAPQKIQATQSEMADLALLDDQVSSLLTVQRKEPIFFWHGPKHLLMWKINEIQLVLTVRLINLASEPGMPTLGTHAERDLMKLIGKPQPDEEPFRAASPSSKVPPFGVILGEADCGPKAKKKACTLGGLMGDQDEGWVHVLVKPSGAKALFNIRNILGLARQVDLFLSVQLPEEAAKGKDVFMNVTKDIMSRLGRERVDILWVPYNAFKKEAWTGIGQALKELKQVGTIKSFGVMKDIPTPKVMKQLFTKTPSPEAWLTTHDAFSPADNDCLSVAFEHGISVVAFPRKPLGGHMAPYAHLLSDKHPEEEALPHRASLSQGLAVVMAPHPHLFHIKKQLSKPLLDTEKRILSIAAFTAVPHTRSIDESSKIAAGECLESALHAGRVVSHESLKSEKQIWHIHGGPRHTPKNLYLGHVFEPSVRKETLHNLEAQRKTYKENNHVIYKEDFFDNDTWNRIVAETERLWTSKDMKPNCNLDGVNRLGGYVLDHEVREEEEIYDNKNSLYNLIYGNEQFRRWVSDVNGEGNAYPADFPIELREYGPKSDGMMCHPDLQMYAVPKQDMEFAVTVSNDSPCEVTFYDAQNNKKTVKTKPNSVMMVRVNSAVHCVSGTKGGKRSILKFIYVGDYLKSKDFWKYTSNECEASNPNVKMMQDIRDAHREKLRVEHDERWARRDRGEL